MSNDNVVPMMIGPTTIDDQVREALKTTTAVTFADRLTLVMQVAGLTQSGLARQVWGEKENNRGNMVAKNREQVRNYLLSGRIPRQKALVEISTALGLTPGELFPAAHKQGHIAANSQIAVSTTGEAKLNLNVTLPLDKVLRILQIVNEE